MLLKANKTFLYAQLWCCHVWLSMNHSLMHSSQYKHNQKKHQGHPCMKGSGSRVFERSTFTEGFSGDAERSALVLVFSKKHCLIGQWLSLKLCYINPSHRWALGLLCLDFSVSQLRFLIKETVIRGHKAGNESGLEEASMRLLGQHYSTGHYNTAAQRHTWY